MLLRGHDVAGVDLALRRESTVASLSPDLRLEIERTSSADLIEILTSFDLVVVDAPLSLPKEGGFRDFERVLLRMGYRLLPTKQGPMRELALLGASLASKLRSKGVIVLETHPTSALKAMSLDRGALMNVLKELLGENGIPQHLDEDAIDATICLVVGILYRAGQYVEISGSEGSIVLPKGVYGAVELRDILSDFL